MDIVYERIEQDKTYNFISKEGKLLSKLWFENAYDFIYGYAAVKLNGKWNFINKQGKHLFCEWFNRIFSTHMDYSFDDYIVVRKDIKSRYEDIRKYNWIKPSKEYKLILPKCEWADDLSWFRYDNDNNIDRNTGNIIVTMNDKCCWHTIDGNRVGEWSYKRLNQKATYEEMYYTGLIPD